MATTGSIDGNIALTFTFNDRRTVSTGTAGNLPTNVVDAQTGPFSTGSGALGVNTVFGYGGANARTFSGTTDVLNLTSGLVDAYGTAVVLARFKTICFKNLSTANNIVIGAGTNPVVSFLNATGTITLPPGAWFAAGTPEATGWVVTASTAMNLTVTGTSGQTYEVAIGGSST